MLFDINHITRFLEDLLSLWKNILQKLGRESPKYSCGGHPLSRYRMVLNMFFQTSPYDIHVVLWCLWCMSVCTLSSLIKPYTVLPSVVLNVLWNTLTTAPSNSFISINHHSKTELGDNLLRCGSSHVRGGKVVYLTPSDFLKKSSVTVSF